MLPGRRRRNSLAVAVWLVCQRQRFLFIQRSGRGPPKGKVVCFLLRTLSTKLNNKMRWELTLVLVLLIVSVSTSFRSSVGGGGSGLAQAWRTSSSPLHVLNFMAATVADLAPSTDVIFDKNTKYSINEASFNDLASIVSLRVNVFYPELKSVVRYVT